MRKKDNIIFVIVSILIITVSCQDEILYEENYDQTITTTKEYPQGEIQIKFLEAMTKSSEFLTRSADSPWTGNREVDNLTRSLGKTRMERIFRSAGKFEAKHRAVGLDRWYRVVFDEQIDPEKIAEKYRELKGIEAAHPSYHGQLVDQGRVVYDHVSKLFPESKLSRNREEIIPFNDPRLADQWHYDHGNLPMYNDAGIGLFKAWKVTSGNSNVIVAVLDQGIDYTHEDLKDNMWINESEYNGIPGVDDDNNGYYDDIYGYNFAENSGEITGCDHGTHIAGTVAAVNNNNIGVSGIAGGSGKGDGVRIMSCQLGNTPTIIKGYEEAMVYAADNGALIQQCSWVVKPSTALFDAITYFNENAGQWEGSPMKGGISIFAAGNENTKMRNYPAAYSHTVSVAALNQNNKRAYYSNYGDWIDICAPGGGGSAGSKAYEVLSTLPDNKYGYFSGTSMACPHVSGVAALLISAHGHSGYTVAMLKEKLLGSTIAVHPEEPNADLLGRGLLRADIALWNDDLVSPDPITDLQFEKSRVGFKLFWSVTSDPNDIKPYQYTILMDQSSIDDPEDSFEKIVLRVNDLMPSERMEYTLKNFPKNGTWNIAVVGEDTWGNKSDLSNQIKIEWNNDQVAPDKVLDLVIKNVSGKLYLEWTNPLDRNDGVASYYLIKTEQVRSDGVTEEIANVEVITEGKVNDITRWQIPYEIDDQYFFSVAAVDLWGNRSDFSQAVNYFPISADELKIFPNPVINELNIAWGKNFVGKKMIYIIDQGGRRILSQELLTDGFQDTVNLTKLSPGRYIVEFHSAEKIERRKIVKINA